MAVGSVRDVLYTINGTLALLKNAKGRKDKISEALVAIQNAVIETKMFINESGYKPNKELSKLWLESFEKVKKAGIYNKKEFPEYLYNKARFWGDPQTWLQEPGCLELVPTLKQLEDECDSILVRLK